MSDTPIAERLAAELGMPWPLRRSWHINGELFESPELALGSVIGDGESPNGCGPVTAGPHPPTRGEADG